MIILLINNLLLGCPNNSHFNGSNLLALISHLLNFMLIRNARFRRMHTAACPCLVPSYMKWVTTTQLKWVKLSPQTPVLSRFMPWWMPLLLSKPRSIAQCNSYLQTSLSLPLLFNGERASLSEATALALHSPVAHPSWALSARRQVTPGADTPVATRAPRAAGSRAPAPPCSLTACSG